MPGPEFDIVKNIEALEWTKAELVGSLSRLFKALLKGEAESILDSLALLIINCYLLLKRTGLNFGQLEMRVCEKTTELLSAGHPLEEGYKDLSSLKSYLDLKR
ncbi:MAG: MazG-like family protein [Clostridia bacterium]|jgi:hypothetical protein|nr:MazG-like family protein [Clostridia bacterium]